MNPKIYSNAVRSMIPLIAVLELRKQQATNEDDGLFYAALEKTVLQIANVFAGEAMARGEVTGKNKQ